MGGDALDHSYQGEEEHQEGGNRKDVVGCADRNLQGRHFASHGLLDEEEAFLEDHEGKPEGNPIHEDDDPHADSCREQREDDREPHMGVRPETSRRTKERGPHHADKAELFGPELTRSQDVTGHDLPANHAGEQSEDSCCDGGDHSLKSIERAAHPVKSGAHREGHKVKRETVELSQPRPPN